MSGVCWIKVAVAGVLAAGAAWSSGAIARQIVQPEMLAAPVYKIEIAAAAPVTTGTSRTVATPDEKEAGATPPATAETPTSVLPLLAGADPVKGQQIAKVCTACHTFEKDGPNKVGPNLWGIVNSHRAHLGDGFAYSAAMKSAGGTWDYDALNAFLTKPRQVVPGTKMAFAGLSKPEDRANVIAFMRTLADAPAPLP